MSAPVLLRFSPHVLLAALCAGLAAANLARAPWIGLAAAAAASALAAAAAHGTGRLLLFALALAGSGLWWGSIRLEELDQSILADRVGEAGRTILAVTAPARRTPFEVRVHADVRSFHGEPLREPVLLKLPPRRAPPQGSLLETVAEVKLPREAEDGFDERAYLRRRGVHVVLEARFWRLVGRRGGLGGLSDRLRARLARTIAPGLEGERRAVLAGVVLGEDEGLSDELRQDFRASGLYHLLAVSGQNVALVAGGMLLVTWLLGLSRWIGEVGALGAIGAYVLAVGWQPSVVRAGVAGALASLAWLAARPRDRWYFLLLGAAVLLAWNPYNLLEPGFQLSFAAVAAIFVAVPALERRLEGYPVPRRLAAVVALSAACGAATAPILWLHFGAVPLFSVLSNALAAAVVAPLFGLALLTAVVEPVLPGAAGALAWVTGWLAAYLAGCARLVGGLPYAQVSSSTAVLALVALAALIVLARRLPSRGRRRLAAVVAAGLALVAGWRLWPQPVPPPPSGLRITFLDVGQGDGIVIQVPEGAVVVDQGPPEANVDRQLRRLGIRRIALLVLTHPQRDHVGGAAEVLEAIRVGTVLDPGIPSESPEEEAALTEARRRRVPIVLARAGRAYALGRLRLRVLWPDATGLPGADPNKQATVLLVSYGEVDALLAADAESDVTLPLHPPPVEILKVAHHGSSDTGLPRLLQLLRPRVAVISCGANNDYGHPAPSTVAALEDAPGLSVFRTDRDGRVVVDSDGERISVRDER